MEVTTITSSTTMTYSRNPGRPTNRTDGMRTFPSMPPGCSGNYRQRGSSVAKMIHLSLESKEVQPRDSMQHLWANRGVIVRTTAVLCVLLVFAIGTVQAVHSHPDSAKTAQHSCSICSVPGAKLNTQTVSPAPAMVAVPVARIEKTAPRIFRPTTTNLVRPPPAA